MSAVDWQGFAPIVVGCAGQALTDNEIALFKRHRPLGFILFARNIDTPAQVKSLVAQFRAVVGNAQAPVLIDQEGGRVARLKPPHWPVFPAGARFGELYAADPQAACEAAYLNAAAIAAELTALGIDVDCAPVADLPVAGAHDVIGDRAYGFSAQQVADIARAVMHGLLDAGVLPVVKHIPGHGRARADSHLELPRVDADRATLEASDFQPFVQLADKHTGAPWAMTAHILYTALDVAQPATTSARIIAEVIRGHIGFDGVLISDDLTMKALAGDVVSRGQAALAAGCDLALHCSGAFDEMQSLLQALPAMDAQAAARVAKAAARKPAAPKALSAADRTRLDQLLNQNLPRAAAG
ncbi:beta-N-acetylhexosaminidase [Ferrovibrio sp.]|uniref:beta-N-acetylhexosaminidase n=1 Tax=Ferrovibrio sp. TaxID=1917215 RepID=UPI0035B44345